MALFQLDSLKHSTLVLVLQQTLVQKVIRHSTQVSCFRFLFSDNFGCKYWSLRGKKSMQHFYIQDFLQF